MQVKWSRKALSNLDDAVDYIAADNPAVATQTAQRIWDCAQRLADQPAMGRPGRVPGTRELAVPGLPYILLYAVRSGAVIILRVLHTSMQWPTKL